jgi:sortase B
MKKLMAWTKEMEKTRRYIVIDRKAVKGLIAIIITLSLLAGCGAKEAKETTTEDSGSVVDFKELRDGNSDIFAWIYIPDTDINDPIVQNSEGDDSFYKTHNVAKEPDGNGAVYIEAANMSNMCDFNEVVHGTSVATLNQFLDRTFFDNHQFIYVYMDGNSLIYYIVAAYMREDTRLLEQYDFSYALGCLQFIDEIYSGKAMNKNIREGWETGLSPEHFLITLDGNVSGKQVVVIGCLVGDAAGRIDRVVDWSSPDDE